MTFQIVSHRRPIQLNKNDLSVRQKVKTSYSRLVGTIAIFFFAGLYTLAFAQSEAPTFLVKPYLQFSTKTSIRILWETDKQTSSKVLFGKAVTGAKVPVLIEEASAEGIRFMHEVELNNLTPETNYFWKAISETSDGEVLESEVYTFKSVVNDSTAFMFALVADTQRNGRTPWAWDSVATAVWKERPNFTLLAGDLVDWGHKKEEWINEFLAPGHDLMSRIPLYAVLGNHEGDADYYYQYMANPLPEYWYTFKYGNAEFFMIDSNRDLSEGSDQYNWLEQQLAKSNAAWKIAVHHHPPYSSESDDHGNTFKGAKSTLGHEKVRDLPKLFDQYGVDFSLFGHTHVYERTWPLKNNRIHQREGTVYINAGGAGGGLETLAPTRNWFTLAIQEGHHYCTFAIYDQTMIFRAIDYTGRVFDTFQLNKATERDEVTIVQPPAPTIESQKYVFSSETEVSFEEGLRGLSVFYTLDGSEPTRRSNAYQGLFLLDQSAEVKARSFNEEGRASRVVSKSFKKVDVLPSTNLKKGKAGLVYKVYSVDWRENVLKVENLTFEGVTHGLNLNDIDLKDDYGVVTMDGYFKVDKTDTYTFYALNPAHLSVKCDGQEVVAGESEPHNVFQLVLEEGWHQLEIVSYQRKWGKAFALGFWDEMIGRKPIPHFNLKHK
ncbi:MAG: metallophosphoesterase [Bacteroidota bacterium]